nr:glycosyltransferase family 4 protein [Stenotrophomonas mori]
MALGLVSVFGIAFLATALARAYALRRRLLDQPGERRSHAVATARGGGIAIVVSQLLAYLGIGMAVPQAAPTLAVFSAGLVLVAGIGWWDDHRPLPAWPRLGVHVLAGALLGALVWYWTGDALKAGFIALLTVALINIWNFMDGIDGLAATQALLAALAYALWLSPPFALPALLLAAGVLGFLPFNFPRARIFMGDVGSGALGYLLAGLVALGIAEGRVAWALWLMPLTAFCIDAGGTLLSRMLNGERWMEAHTQHLYQLHVKRGLSHITLTCNYAVFSIVGITLACAFARLSPAWGTGAAVAWSTMGLGLWWVSRSSVR